MARIAVRPGTENRRARLGQATGQGTRSRTGEYCMKSSQANAGSEHTPDTGSRQPLTERAREACGVLPAAARAEAETIIELLRQLGCDDETCAAALWYSLSRGMPGATDDAAASWPASLRRVVDGQGEAEKVWALHAQRGPATGSEGLRRLLLAIIRDLRVVFVLLARQLAAMRTAMSLPDAERRELAQLTADIHAPLANRLGIWQLKWELEDLAFRYEDPDTYKRIAKLLDEKRVERETYVASAIERLQQELAAAHIRAEVSGRPKHIYSIWRKMRGKALDFAELYDVRAFRVIVPDIKDCYTVP